MTLRLVQLIAKDGKRAVAVLAEDRRARLVDGSASTYALAMRAIAGGFTLQQAVDKAELGEAVDIFAALAEGRVLAPLDHPADPAHLIVSGTGLTHLGSAEGRDKMHRSLEAEANLTDSMKMFKLGLQTGKPKRGEDGGQPG